MIYNISFIASFYNFLSLGYTVHCMYAFYDRLPKTMHVILIGLRIKIAVMGKKSSYERNRLTA
jgi:hypothetical protein